MIKLDRHIEGLEDQYFSNPTADIQRALDVAHAHYWRTNVVPYDIVQMLWFEELEAIQEQKALAHREEEEVSEAEDYIRLHCNIGDDEWTDDVPF